MHKTSDLNDNYMGSGLNIRRAIKKHGVKNFKKEYISVFDCAEDMYLAEAEIVNENFISRQDTYNLKIGGKGGFEHISTEMRRLGQTKGSETFRNKLQTNPNFAQMISDKCRASSKIRSDMMANDEEFAKKIIENCRKGGKAPRVKINTDSVSIERNKAHCRKNAKSGGLATAKKYPNGTMAGTRWIFNLELKLSKTIHRDDPIPVGWQLGRKMFK